MQRKLWLCLKRHPDGSEGERREVQPLGIRKHYKVPGASVVREKAVEEH